MRLVHRRRSSVGASPCSRDEPAVVDTADRLDSLGAHLGLSHNVSCRSYTRGRRARPSLRPRNRDLPINRQIFHSFFATSRAFPPQRFIPPARRRQRTPGFQTPRPTALDCIVLARGSLVFFDRSSAFYELELDASVLGMTARATIGADGPAVSIGGDFNA